MKLIVVLATLCGVSLAYSRIDHRFADLLVSTKVGQIRGLNDDRGYFKFLGIPYGQVGRNIFGAATPHPPFDDIFEAYDDSNICAQMNNPSPVGTADCLNLNIYVPDSADSSHSLPVMIWLYGGAFIEGSAIEPAGNPTSLLRHDVIVVTINYRVGVFGFMCLDIPEVPGNTGLKDQVLALRWIKENIEAFGGDPNQITLFGQSAGGMSTNLHLLSPHEKLFDRVIIQSGPAISYWTIVESDKTIPIRLAEALGLSTEDIYEALDFLMDVDAQTLAQVAHSLVISNSDRTNQPLTKPCVEQKFEGVEHFLTEHPMNIKSEKTLNTPIMIGYNDNEFAFQYANVDSTFFDTYDFSQHFAMGFNTNEDLSKGIHVVNHFYLADEDISENVRWEIIDFGSDFIFNHPTQRMAQKFLNDGAENVFYYIYSYEGNNYYSSSKTWPGATHGEELKYLFDLTHLLHDPGSSVTSVEDQLIIDRLTLMWTNFAKYGDPTPTTSELLPVKWTPITNTTLPYLQIDLEMKIDNRPFHDRMAFWDLFYKKYGHYQKWYNSEADDEVDPDIETDPDTEADSDAEAGTDVEDEDNNSYRNLASPAVIFLAMFYFFLSDV